MDPILETLYREHDSLKDKLSNLEALILSYGGSLIREMPKNQSVSPVLDLKTEQPKIDSHAFLHASWKQKIVLAIEKLGKPSSVVEITDFLAELDLGIDKPKIHKSVTLYCSSLSLKGEMGVDKSGEVNRYFVVTK